MCEYAASMPCEFARIGAHYVLTIQSVIAWDPISVQMKCKMLNFAQGEGGNCKQTSNSNEGRQRSCVMIDMRKRQ